MCEDPFLPCEDRCECVRIVLTLFSKYGILVSLQVRKLV